MCCQEEVRVLKRNIFSTDGALVCLPVCGDYQSINFILCPEANMCHILKGNLDMSARVINCKNIKTELSFTVSFT